MTYGSRIVHALRGVVFAAAGWMVLCAPVLAQDRAAQNPNTQAAAANEAARERAAQHFDRGVALFRDGAFEGALVEFRRAYDAVPNPGLLFNLGQTAMRLNDYAQAKVHFERYLQASGNELSPERRKLVDSELEQLRGRIGYTQVSVSVSGAEIWVDQRSVGRSPLSDPLPLNVGRHRVEVRADGYQDQVQTVELAGGEERTLQFNLQRLSAQLGGSTATPEQQEAAQPAPASLERGWLRPARIASLALFGVAAAGAIATGVMAAKAHTKLGSELSARPGDPDAIDDARSRTKTLSLTSDLFLGAAIVGAGLSVTFLWMEHADNKAVGLAAGPASLTVRGVF